ncbi:MAG: type II secretion system F family protein [Kiritimatiellae bacterium]|nr:type II secretion system F family protein [Kiritimatiellia bacterium]
MNSEIAVIQIIVFMAVLFLVTGINSIVRREHTTLAVKKPWVFRVFYKEIDVLGKMSGNQLEQVFLAQTRKIRNDLVAGALPVNVVEVRGLQAFIGVALAVVAAVITFIICLNWLYALCAGLLLMLLGWYYPLSWVARVAFQRKEAMSRSLPYAIDLITVAMEAGQDFGAAVRNLVAQGPQGALRDEFGVMLRETELGKSRVEALQMMSEKIQLDEFRSLVTAVVQSSEMGSSIAGTLKMQAEEIRRQRYNKAERQAARAPSLMLIPTALFILPAVFIIIIVPIAIKAMESGVSGYMGQGG